MLFRSSVDQQQNPIAVACGTSHTVLLKNKKVTCWGSNREGQSTVPQAVNDGEPIAIACGEYHTAAIIKNNGAENAGTVVCWGFNTSGQCTVPQGLNDVIAIACGYNHTAAVRADGTVVCWGNNDAGQLNVPTY